MNAYPRTLLILSLFLLTAVGSYGEETEDPETIDRTEEFFQREIIELTERKAELSEMAAKEPDAKKRFQIEEAVKKSEEALSWRIKERDEASALQKKEYAQLGDDARNQLNALYEEITTPEMTEPLQPAVAPTPLPETYETESGFKVRLRFTE